MMYLEQQEYGKYCPCQRLTLESQSNVSKPTDVVYMSDTITHNTLIMQPEVITLNLT
jgi:hypothetical protein